MWPWEPITWQQRNQAARKKRQAAQTRTEAPGKEARVPQGRRHQPRGKDPKAVILNHRKPPDPKENVESRGVPSLFVGLELSLHDARQNDRMMRSYIVGPEGRYLNN